MRIVIRRIDCSAFNAFQVAMRDSVAEFCHVYAAHRLVARPNPASRREPSCTCFIFDCRFWGGIIGGACESSSCAENDVAPARSDLVASTCDAPRARFAPRSGDDTANSRLRGQICQLPCSVRPHLSTPPQRPPPGRRRSDDHLPLNPLSVSQSPARMLFFGACRFSNHKDPMWPTAATRDGCRRCREQHRLAHAFFWCKRPWLLHHGCRCPRRAPGEEV